MTGRIARLARLRRIASNECSSKGQSHSRTPPELSQVHQPPTPTSTLPKFSTAELSLVRRQPSQPLRFQTLRPVLSLQRYSVCRRGPESRNFSDAVVTLADGRTLLKQFASLKQLSWVVATKLGLDTKWEAAMTGARATKLDSDFSAFETACEKSNRKGFACLADALSDADFRRSPRTLLVQRNEPSSSDVFTIELRVRWDKGSRIRLQLPPMKYPVLAFENTTTGASCVTVRLYADCPAEHNNDPSSKPTPAMLIPQEVAFLTDAVDTVVDRICQAATFDHAKWAAAAIAAAILKFVAFRTASLPLYTVRVHIDPHRPNGGHAIAFRSTRPGLDPRLRNDDAEIQVQALSNSTERAEGEKRDNSEHDDTDERASCHQEGSVSSEAIKPDGEASSHTGDMAVYQNALPQSSEYADDLTGHPARVTKSDGKIDDEAAAEQQESNHGNCLDDSEITSTEQERHQGEHHFDAVVENTPGLSDGQQELLWRKNVILALGSNVGDRFKNIEDACDKLDESDDIRVVETSPLYETEPMYVEDQGRFLNGACAIETTLKPMELLDRLQAIENDLGRVKFIDKGPRNIDLDIIAYDQEVVDNERLTVPHRLMTEREFVLRPFARLQASFSWRHPITQLTAKDHLDNLPVSATPMTSVTPLSPLSEPLRAMDASRQTRIMSILNVTPDSFSDGGVHVPTDLEALKATVASHIAAGATIIDIGGQSSRPNAPDITAEEEIARILPAIEAINSLPEATNISISIDTYRAAVAEAAIKAGAHIINDVSAGLLDPDMLSTIARLKCTYIMMHMRGTPATMQSSENTSYPLGVMETVRSELIERVDAAQRAGIRLWRIILDPGFGFAKTLEQNLHLLRTFHKLRRLRLRNLPWLVGTSRKGFIGKITGTEVAAERIGGTAATVSRAVMVGADIVRVHDVEIMRQAVRMTEAIYRTCRSEEEQ